MAHTKEGDVCKRQPSELQNIRTVLIDPKIDFSISPRGHFPSSLAEHNMEVPCGGRDCCHPGSKGLPDILVGRKNVGGSSVRKSIRPSSSPPSQVTTGFVGLSSSGVPHATSTLPMPRVSRVHVLKDK